MPATRFQPAQIISQSGRAGRAAHRPGAPPARNRAGRGASPRAGLLFHVPSFSIGLVLGAAVVLVTGYLPELLAPPPQPAESKATTSAEQTVQPLRFEFDTILRTTPAPVTAETSAVVEASGTPPVDTTSGAATAPPASPLASAPVVAPTDGPGSAPENAVPGVFERSTPASPSTSAAEPATTPAGAARPPEQPPASFMLQAASFRSRADADRLRAELLLLDLPANTGEVNVGNDVWYRVTVGPFPDQGTANLAKERLRDRNLTAIPFHR